MEESNLENPFDAERDAAHVSASSKNTDVSAKTADFSLTRDPGSLTV